MLGGDIHCGVTSDIHDEETELSIRHVTTSPVTNHVCKVGHSAREHKSEHGTNVQRRPVREDLSRRFHNHGSYVRLKCESASS